MYSPNPRLELVNTHIGFCSVAPLAARNHIISRISQFAIKAVKSCVRQVESTAAVVTWLSDEIDILLFSQVEIKTSSLGRGNRLSESSVGRLLPR